MSISSYNLQGLKENFADWIANITPDKTPFISCLGLDVSNGTEFQWVADRGSFISNFKTTASKEGDVDVSSDYEFSKGSKTYSNYTQIFRRIVKISDTVLATSVYGRPDELAYQLAKASIDLKREIEWRFLNNNTGSKASDTKGGVTSGFIAQCAKPTSLTAGKLPTNTPNADPQTGAVTHFVLDKEDDFSDDVINLMTLNLFQAGSCACHIMYNPLSSKIVETFKFMADGSATTPSQTRLQRFRTCPVTGDSCEIMTYTDTIGQTFELIPNRWMPLNTIYFYNPEDWDMVIFREPEPQKLDPEGSNKVYLVEGEIGLRHKHEYASGVITVKKP